MTDPPADPAAPPPPSGRSPQQNALPRVLVLMATYDGIGFIGEQLDSILAQRDARVRVLASDDLSTDGTYEYLVERASGDERLRLLPRRSAGGVAANFYRLLREARPAPGELVALADQDDIWLPDKISRQLRALAAGADGVSSDVTAFWPDGRRALIHKSQPQRAFDYLLESAGPGCTFLLSARLLTLAQAELADPAGPAAAMQLHDWLLYGLCRARGWTWTILSTPTVDYRQHERNHLGANVGLRSARDRLVMIGQGWHRAGAIRMAAVALTVAAGDPPRSAEPGSGLEPDAAGDRQMPADALAELRTLQTVLIDRGPRARVRLAARAGELRRRPRDRVVFAGLVLIGIW